MAWTLCSKEDVMAIHPVNENILKDFFSDTVEDMIREHTGSTYMGYRIPVTEYHNGDGSNILLVRNPMIQSVTTLLVEGAALTADDYVVFPNHIQLKNTTFPVGSMNVIIIFESGSSAVVPPKVRFTAATMIVAILNYRGRWGADSSLKWGSGQGESNSVGEKSPNMNIGLTSHMVTILKRMLPRDKVKIG